MNLMTRNFGSHWSVRYTRGPVRMKTTTTLYMWLAFAYFRRLVRFDSAHFCSRNQTCYVSIPYLWQGLYRNASLHRCVGVRTDLAIQRDLFKLRCGPLHLLFLLK